MENNIYISDILDQPQALQTALSRFDPRRLDALARAFQRGDFDRVILTGMGASYFGAYPAWLALAHSGVPAIWVETGELVHYAQDAISPRSLVWIVSQSGRSAEVVSLLNILRSVTPGAILATVNDLESPLAQSVQMLGDLSRLLPIDARPETSVSTRTYLNTLALTQLAAKHLCGELLMPHLDDLQATLLGMQAYLADFETHVKETGEAIGLPTHLVMLGRGSSLATSSCGALIMGEAAKAPAFSMSAGEFRHGPLELCGPDLTALLFAGPRETQSLNKKLFGELAGYQVKAFWIEPGAMGAGSGRLPTPAARGLGLPLAEMLPVQALAVHLCQRKGITPGTMRFIGKVTEKE